MKQTFIFLSFIFCFVSIQAVQKNIPDSLLTEYHIRNIQLQYPDSALYLLDIAEQRQLSSLPLFKIEILRSNVYGAKGMNMMKEKCARRALQSDSVQLVVQRKLNLLTTLAKALEIQGKYEESIQTISEAIDLARREGNRAEEGKLLFTMARAYIGMSRLDVALMYFDQAIEVLSRKGGGIDELSRLSSAYAEKITALVMKERLDEAIETGYLREAVIQRMKELEGMPPGYIDQQYGLHYTRMAFVLQRAGQLEEASKTYQHFKETDFSHKEVAVQYSVPYLLEAHRYREALEENEIALTQFKGDTLNLHYWILLERHAKAFRGLGKYEQADSYQLRISELQEGIYQREKESHALELSGIFHLNEKELQLSEVQAESERRIMLFIGACIVMVLLLTLLWIIWINLRKTRRRNRIVAKQIDELLAQREELRKAFAQNAKGGQQRNDNRKVQLSDEDGDVEPVNGDETTIDTDSSEKQRSDYASFMRMENIIIGDKLFLQPKFGRDDLLRVTNIKKNDLGRLLRVYAGVNNISDYLNRLRVEYSVKLMKEKSHLSIDAIAEEASFNSRSTFYRAFYKVFGMIPTQYIKH